jgi:excisionase family DNA binding protein
MTMLTPKQAADKIGVSDSLIYEWCNAGLLAHYRFGRKGRRGKIMIEEGDFEMFLARCKQQAHLQDDTPPLKHIRLD